MQLMNNLDFKTAVEEIKTAAKWLRDSGSPKVSLNIYTSLLRELVQDI